MRPFRRTQTVRAVILAATVSALLSATLPFAGSPARGAPLDILAAQPPPAPLSQATPTATPAAAAAQPIPATPTVAAGAAAPPPPAGAAAATPTVAAGAAAPPAAAPPAPAGAAAAPPAAGAATAAGAAIAAPQPTITMTPIAVVLSSVCSNRPAAAAAAAMSAPPAMGMPTGGMPAGGMPAMGMPAGLPMASPFGLNMMAPSPFSPFSSLPLLGGLPGIPGFGPPMLAGPPSLAMPAMPAVAAAPAPPANSPVVTCVNTTSGIALSWTPYSAPSGTVTYTVYQCDRNSTPGQPGCALVFTTDAPTLFGPVSLGYDYVVQAQAPPNVIIVSNRLSL